MASLEVGTPPRIGNHHKMQVLTGTGRHTERYQTVEITCLTEYLLRNQQIQREGGKGARISKDLLALDANDLQRSAN